MYLYAKINKSHYRSLFVLSLGSACSCIKMGCITSGKGYFQSCYSGKTSEVKAIYHQYNLLYYLQISHLNRKFTRMLFGKCNLMSLHYEVISEIRLALRLGYTYRCWLPLSSWFQCQYEVLQVTRRDEHVSGGITHWVVHSFFHQSENQRSCTSGWNWKASLILFKSGMMRVWPLKVILCPPKLSVTLRSG